MPTGYTVPPRAIGKLVTLKANRTAITIYDQEKTLAVHSRCWDRKKRIELPSHQEQVKKMRRKLWQDRDIVAFISLGHEAEGYLKALADAGQPIKKMSPGFYLQKTNTALSPLSMQSKKRFNTKHMGRTILKTFSIRK